MKITTIYRTLLVVATGMCLCLQSVWAVPYVELKSGKVAGTSIRSNKDGDVFLTTQSGERTFQKGQYISARDDMPDEFTAARQAAAGKKWAEAETLLKGIILRKRYLYWDGQAGVLLAQIQISQGKAAEAERTVKEIVQRQPTIINQVPSLELVYWSALIESKKFDQVEPMLEKAIIGSSRERAARGQIARGDLKLKKNQHEAALLDYLRTVMFFQKQQDVQAEALFKTAEVMSTLKDARAKDFYGRAAEFADTPYGRKAQEKL